MKKNKQRNKQKKKQKEVKILVYFIAIVVLILLIGIFFCLRGQPISQGYHDLATKINSKDLEAKKAGLAKEELLKNYLMEDFNLKIKDADFEKLVFEKNIPILMYHYIEADNPSQSALRRNLSITPENFEKQMRWLYDNGFKTLTLSHYFSLIAEQKDIPTKSVLITIDDGYIDFFENAVPILNRYNMTATIFVIADLVDSPAFMSWDQIRLLSDQGFEFGSHSSTHLNLRNVNDDRLKNEIVDSKKKIEEKIGKNINFFCYPTGAYDDGTEKAVRDAGYRGSVNTVNGSRISNKNMFELPRFRIARTMSLDGFAWTMNNTQ